MIKTILVVLLTLLNNQLLLAETKHRPLDAHEHGSIKLSIVLEKNVVEMELEGPSESFLGFEHAPKSKKEIQKFNDVKQRWTNDFMSLFIFDIKLNCKLATAKLEQIIEEEHKDEHKEEHKDNHKKDSGVHSEISAQAKLNCDQNPASSVAVVNFKKYFKGIKKLTVEIIGKDSKSVSITKDSQSITL
jgi:hypothetical protein